MASKSPRISTKAKTDKYSTKWVKNAVKSIGIGYSEALSTIAPNIYDTAAVGRDVTNRVIRSIKGNRTGEERIHGVLKNNKYVATMQKAYKNAMADIRTGNFFGDENYIVTTAETYKRLMDDGDLSDGTLINYVKENYPESSTNFGFMIAVPKSVDGRSYNLVYQELENPTPLNDIHEFKMIKINCGHALTKRDRSLVELMFCMLRAKHNYSNRS